VLVKPPSRFVIPVWLEENYSGLFSAKQKKRGKNIFSATMSESEDISAKHPNNTFAVNNGHREATGTDDPTLITALQVVKYMSVRSMSV